MPASHRGSTPIARRASAAAHALLAVLASACAAAASAAERAPPRPSEALSFRAPPPMAAAKWALGNRQVSGDGSRLAEYVPDGQRIAEWSELMTLHVGRAGPAHPSPERVLEGMRERQERLCAGATRWRMHANDAAAVVYEWRAGPCQGWPPQHEIAAILLGSRNLFIVRYTVKAPEMPEQVRHAWLERLGAARIVATPAR